MVFELNPKCITYRLDGWTIFLFSFWSLFVCIFLSWVNDYKASATFQEHLCSCFKKKKVYVWSLISLKLSHCLAISLLLYTVLAHYVRGKCGQMWRRPEELVNTEKCLVHLGFTCLTFSFLRKKLHEWKNKKPLYTVSVKMAYLFWFLASTPHRLEFCVAWGRVLTPKKQFVARFEAACPFRAVTLVLHSEYWGPGLTTRCYELAPTPFFSRIKSSLIWEPAPFQWNGGAYSPPCL